MAEYRRFVAYVYEYHKGKKGSNCGFIQVEARDRLLRAEVHLKCPGLIPNVNCGIYGFTRGRGTLEGHLMGSCRTAAGRADCVLETERNRIGGQEVSLEQLGGMVLVMENGGFFGTEWDDQPIRPENFRENRQTVRKPDEKAQKDLSAEPVKEADKMEEPEAEKAAEKEKEAEPPEETEKDPQPEETDLKTQTVDDMCEEVSEQQSDFTENGSEQVHDSAEEDSGKQDNSEKINLEAGPDQKDFSSADAPAQAPKPEAESKSDAKSGLEENSSVWEPFSDGELTECRKIGVQDLGNLGRQDCCLRNNRFLQHGFYQFGHLLLCKNPGGQYMLGVPGGYSGQERYMANMFGFPWFKESSEIQISGCRGGYWYRYMGSDARRQ